MYHAVRVVTRDVGARRGPPLVSRLTSYSRAPTRANPYCTPGGDYGIIFQMDQSAAGQPGETHGDETRKHGKQVLAEGDRFGDCTIVRPLGTGGMGQVYLAKSADGINYALKVLHPDLEHRSTDMKRRFLHEAEFLMTIRHRNLVEVFDAGEDPEMGLCYILMEYMPGGSLGDLIAREGRLPVDKAISYVSQTADALSVAHKQGVIHRDIKPDNILFTEDGVPKLTDPAWPSSSTMPSTPR